MQTIKPNYSDMNIPTSHRPLTRFQRIMQEMTVERMAEIVTEATESPDTWHDMTVTSYHNEAGDFYIYEDAIQAEIEYLNEVDV